ncbi:MAG: hypothetical protein PHE67_09065 [Campylobacterales bacterium]|nr:hypothetical protein [Campylobacterales bacterium]
MRIALPVHKDGVKIFKNAGHTPFFAVYEIVGAGMFRSFKLIELRANPRINEDHEDECEDAHGKCHHEGDAEEHKNDHRIMAEIVKDCEVLGVDKACKNTKLVFEEVGIKVIATHGCEKTDDMLREVSKKI